MCDEVLGQPKFRFGETDSSSLSENFVGRRSIRAYPISIEDQTVIKKMKLKNFQRTKTMRKNFES